MGDHRPDALDRHIATLTVCAATIADRLTCLPVGIELDVRSRAETGRRGRGVSRPTERAAVEWEAAMLRMSSRLATVVVGAHHEPDGRPPADWTHAAGLTELLGHPLQPTALLDRRPASLADLADEARGGSPSRGPWRQAVTGLCDALTQAASGMQDGWHDLWRDRWRADMRGDRVLDEGIDADLTSYLGYVRQLTNRTTGIRRDVDRPSIRLCACGCGSPAPPYGQGATRPACRQRNHRLRLATG